jgi:hypothetical protein
MKCYFVVEEVYQRYNEGYVAARPQGLIELRTVWNPSGRKTRKSLVNPRVFLDDKKNPRSDSNDKTRPTWISRKRRTILVQNS